MRYVDVQPPFYATVSEESGDSDAQDGLMPEPELIGEETYRPRGVDGRRLIAERPGSLDDLLPARDGTTPNGASGRECVLRLRRLVASEPEIADTTVDASVSTQSSASTSTGRSRVRAVDYDAAAPTATPPTSCAGR